MLPWREQTYVEDFDDFVPRNLKDKAGYVLEPKFDGLSVELVYDGGTVKYGAKRLTSLEVAVGVSASVPSLAYFAAGQRRCLEKI